MKIVDVEDIASQLAAHPHNAYFRYLYSDVGRARALFQEHLSAPLAQRMDWNSLQLLPGSYVKQSLQEIESDLLFSVRVQGGPFMLYVLFEHQSTVDKRMPQRLLGYMQEIWRTYDKDESLPLTPLLPLVLHQGPDRWTVSVHFEDLFALPPGLKEHLLPYLPKFSHHLIDLSQFDVDKDGRTENGVLLVFMKLARAKQVAEFFTGRRRELLLPSGLRLISLLYALNADPSLDVEALVHHIEDEQTKEDLMSTAAALIARGKAEGKAEGEALGEAKGQLKVLQKMMGQPVSSHAELAALDLAELQRRYIELASVYEQQFKR